MADFVINQDTGDVDVVAGTIELTSGPDTIRQRLENRLRMVRGEWFLDVNAGTDYYGQIFGKRTFVQIDAELTRVILTTPGVLALRDNIEYNLDKQRRILSVNFQALTVEGDVEIETTITGV